MWGSSCLAVVTMWQEWRNGMNCLVECLELLYGVEFAAFQPVFALAQCIVANAENGAQARVVKPYLYQAAQVYFAVG